MVSFQFDPATPLESVCFLAKQFIKIYVESVVILFVWLCLLVSTSLQVLIEEVACFSDQPPQGSTVRILRWKRSYHNLHRLVSQMDRQFGPTLFVYMSYVFVYFIFMPYDLFADIQTANGIFIVCTALEIFKYAVFMLMTVFSAKRMDDKVTEKTNFTQFFIFFPIIFA